MLSPPRSSRGGSGVGLSGEPMKASPWRILAATAPPLTPPRKSGEGNSRRLVLPRVTRLIGNRPYPPAFPRLTELRMKGPRRLHSSLHSARSRETSVR
jgi:hypothetical protein